MNANSDSRHGLLPVFFSAKSRKRPCGPVQDKYPRLKRHFISGQSDLSLTMTKPLEQQNTGTLAARMMAVGWVT